MSRIAALALLVLAAGPGVAAFSGSAGHAVYGVAPRPVTPVSVAWRTTEPLARALDAWSNGRRPEALRWFRLAVGVAPRDSVAWHDLGVALFCASRYDDALDAFLKERFLMPNAPSASYGVGECEFALGELAEAERDLFVAVALAPREWEYWQALSEILRAEHREDGARAAQARATALRPRPYRTRWSPLDIQKAIATLRFPRITTFR